MLYEKFFKLVVSYDYGLLLAKIFSYFYLIIVWPFWFINDRVFHSYCNHQWSVVNFIRSDGFYGDKYEYKCKICDKKIRRYEYKMPSEVRLKSRQYDNWYVS